jgi:hypothetical protein
LVSGTALHKESVVALWVSGFVLFEVSVRKIWRAGIDGTEQGVILHGMLL